MPEGWLERAQVSSSLPKKGVHRGSEPDMKQRNFHLLKMGLFASPCTETNSRLGFAIYYGQLARSATLHLNNVPAP